MLNIELKQEQTKYAELLVKLNEKIDYVTNLTIKLDGKRKKVYDYKNAVEYVESQKEETDQLNIFITQNIEEKENHIIKLITQIRNIQTHNIEIAGNYYMLNSSLIDLKIEHAKTLSNNKFLQEELTKKNTLLDDYILNESEKDATVLSLKNENQKLKNQANISRIDFEGAAELSEEEEEKQGEEQDIISNKPEDLIPEELDKNDETIEKSNLKNYVKLLSEKYLLFEGNEILFKNIN